MRKISFVDAINEAIAQGMRENDRVVVYGEDVALAGGVRGVTKNLLQEFGPDRVRDTPISEGVIAGSAVGAAATGLFPVVEIMYADFLGCCADQVINKMAKWRYEHGGVMETPMILRVTNGCGFGGGAEHSQSMEAMLMCFPGYQVFYPSTAEDAQAMYKAAFNDKNPTIMLEHRLLYKTKGEVLDKITDVVATPIGTAKVVREGKDVTVVTLGYQTSIVLKLAEEMKDEVDMEVVDLRFVAPLDKKTVLASVEKTGRLVTIEECHRTGGVGAEIAASIAEDGMFNLVAPIKRVGALDCPIPYSDPLEKYVLPNKERMVAAIREVMAY